MYRKCRLLIVLHWATFNSILVSAIRWSWPFTEVKGTYIRLSLPRILWPIPPIITLDDEFSEHIAKPINTFRDIQSIWNIQHLGNGSRCWHCALSSVRVNMHMKCICMYRTEHVWRYLGTKNRKQDRHCSKDVISGLLALATIYFTTWGHECKNCVGNIDWKR